MLSGKTRVKLLRCLVEESGRNVTQLAGAVGIGISDASQELRRIQSRGLLQAEHRHANLIYRLRADPQVSSALPLLRALRNTLATQTPDADQKIRDLGNSLGHIRRIEMLKELIRSPQTADHLQKRIRTSQACVSRHLQPLLKAGFVERERQLLRYIQPRHPLAKALIRLLPE